MKIVYDSQIFCAQTYGGVSRYFCEIASRIARVEGVEVSITAPMHVNAYLEHVSPRVVSGFRAPGSDLFKSAYARLALRGAGILLGDLMLRGASPDVVHETYYFPYRLGPRGARRVLTIHDMIHEKFAASFPNADKTARYKALAAERADHVICVSESTRRDVVDILGLPTGRISVVHHGFDLMMPAGTHETPPPGGRPYLLYVGHRGGYKNFANLLVAYASSPQLTSTYRLLCFGGGPFLPQELKYIRSLGLDETLVKQIRGDDDLLACTYKRASAFIYPSLYEGFGIPPLEAMAHGCPVVCSNTSSIPEVVGDAGEYFDPRDTASIVSAIERVLGVESYRSQLIKKGNVRLKIFSWDQSAAETLAIYNKVL